MTLSRTLPPALAFALLVLGAAGCSSPGPRREPAAPPVLVPLAVPPRAVAPEVDYLIGPRDLLSVRVLDLEKPDEVSTLELEVSAQGEIAMPFAGVLRVGGKTAAEARALIAARLGADYLVDPQVTVTVKEYLSRQIGVMGAVAKPGVFFLNRNRVSLIEALSLAGGLSKEAGTRAFIVRPKAAAPGGRRAAERIEIDLVALLLKGDSSADLFIEPDWVVQVPPAEPFFVSGYVNKAGAFPYQQPTTVLQAVALAGGLHERKASPSAVTIKRPKGDGVEIIEVDLGKIIAGKSPDVPVRAGDSVEVGRTVLWAIYTETIDAVKGIFGFGISAGAL